jgi:hypothetical protein
MITGIEPEIKDKKKILWCNLQPKITKMVSKEAASSSNLRTLLQKLKKCGK